MDTQPVHQVLQEVRDSLSEAERRDIASTTDEISGTCSHDLSARLEQLEGVITRIDANLERTTASNSSLNERFAELLQQLVSQVGDHDRHISNDQETDSVAHGVRALVGIIKAQNDNIENLTSRLTPNPLELEEPAASDQAHLNQELDEQFSALQSRLSQLLEPLTEQMSKLTAEMAELRVETNVRTVETRPDGSNSAIADVHFKRHASTRLHAGMTLALRDLKAATDELRGSVREISASTSHQQAGDEATTPVVGSETSSHQPEVVEVLPAFAARESLQRLIVGMGLLCRQMTNQTDRWEGFLERLEKRAGDDAPPRAPDTDVLNQSIQEFSKISDTLAEQVSEIQPAVHLAMAKYQPAPPPTVGSTVKPEQIIAMMQRVKSSVSGLITSYDALGSLIDQGTIDPEPLKSIQTAIGTSSHEFLDTAADLGQLVEVNN